MRASRYIEEWWRRIPRPVWWVLKSIKWIVIVAVWIAAILLVLGIWTDLLHLRRPADEIVP